MVPKNVFLAVICAVLLAWSGPSIADEIQPDQYRPNEYLSLDLSKAVLSPKRLGPKAKFAPVAVEARADTKATVRTVRHARIAHEIAPVRAARPRGAVRTRLARRHGNPLDAQALDTRIQVWPCKSGGICNWRR
jgi:hypothetical protein